MSATLKTAISFAFVALLMTGVLPANAASAGQDKGLSPALCGAGDSREPGVQGDVPAGQTANYNCGVKLVGQIPRVGNVQGVGKCAYVRNSGNVYIVDVSDPSKPVETGSVPVKSGSETMRVVTTDTRSILVSGSSVYDVSNCLHPLLKGEIPWPPLHLAGATTTRLLPHDIRVNHTGTKVVASFGMWEADITNLNDPSTWKVVDHSCELAAQQPGPWQEVHKQALKAGHSLCDDEAQATPQGAGWAEGVSPLQASLTWPQLSHSPEFNADDTLLYVGDQAGGNSGLWAPVAKVRIVDMKQTPYKIIGEVDGGGHGLDWFRAGGREYVLATNERGRAQPQDPPGGDTCKPYPRPYSLGWALEGYISDVTQPNKAHHVSMLQIAINDPAFCETRKASGGDASIAYHLIDNPLNAHFAAVNFGTAGLRIYDIRKPEKPQEVAYFNHGTLVHAGVGSYDAARGLIYAAGSSGLWVLEVEPQVRARLGL